MGKKSLILILISFLCFTACSNSKESKAKRLVNSYLKESLNDYDSYSSVSFSDVDSLMTEWKLPEELVPDFENLVQCAKNLNESGYSNIEVTANAEWNIKDLEKFSEEKYQKIYSGEEKKNFYDKIENWKQLWKEFKHYQDIVYGSKEGFVSKFRGWKVTHKYRAKNMDNATVLNEYEFYFDEQMERVTGVKKIQ